MTLHKVIRCSVRLFITFYIIFYYYGSIGNCNSINANYADRIFEELWNRNYVQKRNLYSWKNYSCRVDLKVLRESRNLSNFRVDREAAGLRSLRRRSVYERETHTPDFHRIRAMDVHISSAALLNTFWVEWFPPTWSFSTDQVSCTKAFDCEGKRPQSLRIPFMLLLV